MQKSNDRDIKTVFIYASAVHGSKIVENEQIENTLMQAKQNGFERIVIIKKTQMAAKAKRLSKNFIVSPYPAKSIEKAIANSNACILINGVISTKRKNNRIDRILDEANKRMKFIFSISLEP